MGELRDSDRSIVRRQLGRDPTTPFTVVARCPGGHPLVIRNEPVDANGDPFPTLFWLTCPVAVKSVSRLESAGAVGELNRRTEQDRAFAAALAAAHEAYARERSRGFPDALAWGGVGGTAAGVKCLHAHYANHIAGGDDPVGVWVADRVEPIHAEGDRGRVAAIDLGTNSVRLLVASAGQDGDLDGSARDMVITRIGQDVDRTGRIDPDALARTVAVLERYSRRARALHAERIRVAATSAVREVSNREELERAVREHTGVDLEVISGEQEAALSFLGSTRGLGPRHEPDASDGLDALPPYLVLDIGGGSAEFAFGTSADRGPEATISTHLGSVRLTERFIRSDPPAPEELDAVREETARALAEVEFAVPVAEASTFIAVAGTATTVQAISLGLDRYDPDRIHRTWLSRADAERALADLVAMTNADRAALPVMAPGRGDVIVAGALVLVETLRRFGFERALISETDILDGLALEMLAVR